MKTSPKDHPAAIRAPLFSILLLIAAVASSAYASQPVIRAVSAGSTVGVPSSVTTPSVQSTALRDVNGDIRAWLIQQEEVDKAIFAAQANPLATQDLFQERTSAARTSAEIEVPEVRATRIAGTPVIGKPVIRAVLSQPVVISTASPPRRALCTWPLDCSMRSNPRSRGPVGAKSPSTRAQQFAQTSRLNFSAFAWEIDAASARFGIDPLFVRAIMHAESSFNPWAQSRVGAKGLMQLMPATARRFGVTNAYEASQNITGGTQYLAWLLRRFNGDAQLAAAAYNAGEGAVDRHGGIPPYRETIDYVSKVTTLFTRYQNAEPRRPGR